MFKVVIIGIGIVASLIVIAVLMESVSDSNLPQDMMSDDIITITIGALTAATESLNEEKSIHSMQLAVDDFNEYLKEQEQDWQLELVIETTNADSSDIIEKIAILDQQGIDIVIGPDTSAGIQMITQYVESNGIAIISCCSTAPSLAIPNDSIYRIHPDDRTIGHVIANIMYDKGIKTLVPLYRGDLWGDELYSSAAESFVELGGTVNKGVRYEPGSSKFSSDIETIVAQVESSSLEYGPNNVGVLLIGFDEKLDYMRSAADYEILKDVRWFGSDASFELIGDDVGEAFAKDTQYTTVQFSIDKNLISERLNTHISNMFGQPPSIYEYTAYDAVWLAGLAMLESEERDANAIRTNIIKVSQDYQGAIGPSALNTSGDLIASNFEIMQMIDERWMVVGKYTLEDDSILWNLDNSLSGVITIGILLPLDGDLASIGREANQGALLAVDDLNQYLEDQDQDWKLDVIIEDTKTRPEIALERLEYLHTGGVDVIIGPGASGSVSYIKEYADTNDMILLSCCSTAPSLSIPDDSVYRIIPDDSKQGPAMASIMMDQGVQAYVPLYRNDTWGHGLHKTAADAFVSMGGTADEPVIYPDDIHDIEDVTRQLSDQIQILIDKYGSNHVGVLFIGFSEGVEFMQESSKYDILDDIRWFGSSASAKEQKILDDTTSREFAIRTEFTTVQFSIEQNIITQRIADHINRTLGHTPSIYAYTAYDAVWLAGLAILKAESSSAVDVRSLIIPTSEEYIGALGQIRLNAAGDLVAGDYTIWGISDDQWSDMGKYRSEDQTISWNE